MDKNMVRLSDHISILSGTNPGSIALLKNLGIYTVNDLATSAVFLLATQLEKAASAIVRKGQRIQEIPPAMDLIDLEYRTYPIEQLASKPVSAITSIGKTYSKQVENEMGVKTIGQLAKWPPYEIAKSVQSESLGGLGVIINEDPEMPSDLVPGTGRYPTERVQYDVILLDKIIRKQETGKTIPPISQVDPNYNTNTKIERPIRPIEVDFLPIDISLQPDAGFTNPAVGVVLTYNQSWYTLGLTLGQLLHSIALAPGETTRIAIVDWNRQQTASTKEYINENEALASKLSHNRAISEVTKAVATEAQTGFSKSNNTEASYSFGSGSGVAGEIMGFFGVAGASIGISAGYSETSSIASTSGRRDVSAEMSQNICDRTQQAANSSRNRRASIIREVSQKESETLSTRAVTNFNHMHALTIQYYEIVQLYRTTVELAKVTRCLLLPMKELDFTDINLTRRFRKVLRQAALTREAKDLLVDDFSTIIQGNVSPNGVTLDICNKLKVWFDKAQSESMLELAGERVGEWYIPRAVGTHGAMLIWPAAAKVTRIISRDSKGKVTREEYEILNKGSYGWGHSHIVPMRDWGSIEIEFAKDQPKEVKLPICVEISIELVYLNRIFEYRHIVEVGGEETVGSLGEPIMLVKVKTPPNEEMVISHLQENALYYSQVVWKSMSNAALVAQLEGYTYQDKPLADLVDFTPIATVGNFVAFAFHEKKDESWKEFLEKHPDLDLDNPDNRVRKEDIIPIPSGGVFAEAVLGRFNSAEKLDITRFWNWQDSAIPITAPEISPLQAGSRAQAENILPNQLGQPVLNIVNAPSVPDPTGMNAVLTAISNGNMFRDMSNAAQTMAAATDILKAGFTAAGHSQDVAAQYAQQAANLMASQSTKGTQQGGTTETSANSVPSNISGLGAKYNAAAKLDQESPKSVVIGETEGQNDSNKGDAQVSGASVQNLRTDEVLGTTGSGISGSYGAALNGILQASMGGIPAALEVSGTVVGKIFELIQAGSIELWGATDAQVLLSTHPDISDYVQDDQNDNYTTTIYFNNLGYVAGLANGLTGSIKISWSGHWRLKDSVRDKTNQFLKNYYGKMKVTLEPETLEIGNALAKVKIGAKLKTASEGELKLDLSIPWLQDIPTKLYLQIEFTPSAVLGALFNNTRVMSVEIDLDRRQPEVTIIEYDGKLHLFNGTPEDIGVPYTI